MFLIFLNNFHFSFIFTDIILEEYLEKHLFATVSLKVIVLKIKTKTFVNVCKILSTCLLNNVSYSLSTSFLYLKVLQVCNISNFFLEKD